MPLRSLCTSSTHDILAAFRPCTVARRCCLLFLLRSCSRDQCYAELLLQNATPRRIVQASKTQICGYPDAGDEKGRFAASGSGQA